jgi:cell division protein FtsL
MTKSPNLKKTGLWFLIMSVFILEMFFYTWCRVQNVRFGYEISNEMNHQKKLIAYQNNLKIELARLKSPERITQIAKQQLGLIMPTAEKTILLP